MSSILEMGLSDHPRIEAIDPTPSFMYEDLHCIGVGANIPLDVQHYEDDCYYEDSQIPKESQLPEEPQGHPTVGTSPSAMAGSSTASTAKKLYSDIWEDFDHHRVNGLGGKWQRWGFRKICRKQINTSTEKVRIVFDRMVILARGSLSKEWLCKRNFKPPNLLNLLNRSK